MASSAKSRVKRGGEPGAHFVAAGVEFAIVRLAVGGGIGGEEEEFSGGTGAVLAGGRMPARADAFGGEDNPASSGKADGAAAGFFAGAHEGSDSGASGSDAGGAGEGGPPFGAVGTPAPGAAEADMLLLRLLQRQLRCIPMLSS